MLRRVLALEYASVPDAELLPDVRYGLVVTKVVVVIVAFAARRVLGLQTGTAGSASQGVRKSRARPRLRHSAGAARKWRDGLE